MKDATSKKAKGSLVVITDPNHRAFAKQGTIIKMIRGNTDLLWYAKLNMTDGKSRIVPLKDVELANL